MKWYAENWDISSKFSGKLAAVGYEDGTIKVFDVKAGTVLHHVPQGQAHIGTITDMDCHPDNNLLITGSVYGCAVILKTQTGKVSAWLSCKHLGLYLHFNTQFMKNVLFEWQ